MLIELNGLSFYLHLHRSRSGPDVTARIVDEAFALPPLHAPVIRAGCVFDLVERYCGLSPTRTLRAEIEQRVREIQSAEPVPTAAANRRTAASHRPAAGETDRRGVPIPR